MYLIKKVEFDSLENRINDAIVTTIVGVIDGGEEEAQKWINEHERSIENKYRGWDNKYYPYFTKEPVENLNNGNHEVVETINNDAYSHACECPSCGSKISRDYKERTFYCMTCGTHLHQRAFTQEEIDETLFQHEMDTLKIK